MTTRQPLEPGSPVDLLQCLAELNRAAMNLCSAEARWSAAMALTRASASDAWTERQTYMAEYRAAYDRMRAAIECSGEPPLFS